MKLYVDDRLLGEAGGDTPLNLDTILDRLQDQGQVPEDRIIVAVQVDKRRIDPAVDDIGLMSVLPNDTKIFRVVTESVAVLLREALEDGRAAFEVVAKASVDAVKKLRGGNMPDALKFFGKLMERIQSTMEYWTELRGQLEAYSPDFRFEPVEELLVKFRKTLSDAIGFQQDGDWVMLADTVEYEFVEIFEQFQKLVGGFVNEITVGSD
ncbi:MAG: hypothetical protein KJ042_08385 [Deltaproteobacteria bacterium]|nr:hypothetical protein [Deltaproteobacteria bacterium]